MTNPRVPTRRRASELHKVGVPLVLNDGGTEWVIPEDGGDPVEVPLEPVTLWIAKLTDVETSEAMKAARRMQSITTAKNHPDSPEYQALHALLSELDREALISLLVEREMAGRQQVVEARLAAETEVDPDSGKDVPGKWAKDGYLEGLFSAWNQELKETFAVDPEDPEALRVLDEITAFTQAVDAELAQEAELERSIHSGWSTETLLAKATEQMLAEESAEAWFNEYRLQVVARAARDCDGPDPDRPGRCLCRGSRAQHRELHFKDGYEEVKYMDEKVRDQIYAVWSALTVDPQEGKGLPARPASSTESASLDPAAASSPSSPTA